MARQTNGGAQPPQRPRTGIKPVTAGLVLVGAAVLTFGAIALTAFVVRTVRDDDPPAPLQPVPTLTAPAPEIERSSAADILTNKTLDEMTADERALVAAEARRVFDDSVFRATAPAIVAIEVIRKDGETRAARVWSYREGAGDALVLASAESFYCPVGGGAIDAYTQYFSPIGDTVVDKQTLQPNGAPFELTIDGLVWDQAEDRGFHEIDGRQAHAFEMPFTPFNRSNTIQVEIWLDVENARLLLWQDITSSPDGAFRYVLDYGVPARIEPIDLHDPPCADELYD